MVDFIYTRGLKEVRERRRRALRCRHHRADRLAARERVQRGGPQESLFTSKGDARECEHIRDALDTGAPFELGTALPSRRRRTRARAVADQGLGVPRLAVLPPPDGSTTAVHSMVETLIQFLEALPEPVVPFAFYQRALDASQTHALARQVRPACQEGLQNGMRTRLTCVLCAPGGAGAGARRWWPRCRWCTRTSSCT